MELPTIVITAPSLPDATGYRASTATTGTKLDTPVLETPFSVKTLPPAILDDQQAVRIDKALQNLSGVALIRGNSGLSDELVLRGFAANPYRDGFRFSDQNASGRRDMANIERIEVLKGPGSILYGQSEPGGIVNLVTKKPLRNPFHELEQQSGSFDFNRTTLDTTAQLGEKSAYRLNFAYENSGSFRKFVRGERVFVAPVLRWEPDPAIRADFELDYLRGRETPDDGVPALGGRRLEVPRETFFGEPFNRGTYDDLLLGVNGSWTFSQAWKLRWRFNAERSASEIVNVTTPLSGFTVSRDGRRVSRILEILQDARHDSYFGVLDLSGSFETFGLLHNFLLGGDYYRESIDWGHMAATPYRSLDPAQPVYRSSASIASGSARNRNGDFLHETEDWFGLYLQDQLTLPYGFHALAGFRFDAVEEHGVQSGEAFRQPRSGNLAPRGGLVWQPIPQLALYGSATENFSGINEIGRTGGRLPPETAQQWELGIKSEWAEGQLLGTLAYYRLTKQHVAVPDPLNPLFFIDSGELEIRGLELELAGTVARDWEIIGAYAYTPFAIVTKDQGTVFAPDGETVLGTDFGNTGRRFPNLPRHQGSLWTTYAFDSGGLKGVKLGLGVVSLGERMADNENTARAPGYVTVNLMGSYQRRVGNASMRVQINVDNLLDKDYDASASGRRLMPGTPRSILGSVSISY